MFTYTIVRYGVVRSNMGLLKANSTQLPIQTEYEIRRVWVKIFNPF